MLFKPLRRIRSLLPFRKFRELDVAAIEHVISYRFTNRSLLYTAFTHSSFLSISKEKSHKSNERLEFLGDAVLDLVVTDNLYTRMPTTHEGDLSKIKSVLVSRSVLSEIVYEMELGKYLLLNKGEEKTGGRKRTSNLANLYEAILGAIYLDGGLKPSRRFIESTLMNRQDTLLNHQNFINYKSILLEHVQSTGPGNPIYKLINESGPDHNKKFIMRVSIDKKQKAQGKGSSKKIAEQTAAHNLIKKIAPELLSGKSDEDQL
jgi:ribonuclease-3